MPLIGSATLVWLVAIVSLTRELVAQQPASGAGIPTVTVAYSELLDGGCAMLSGRALDTARVAAVRRREGALGAVWNARGPALLDAARRATGAPFGVREMHAALSTCWPGSMSFPLIINMASARMLAADSASAEILFVGTLFHEILHRYVEERRGRLRDRSTPLIDKYGAEPFRVRNHLHVMALQRVAYEMLRRTAELELVESADKASADSAIMRRVYEIVAAEGAAAFVRELARGSASPASSTPASVRDASAVP